MWILDRQIVEGEHAVERFNHRNYLGSYVNACFVPLGGVSNKYVGSQEERETDIVSCIGSLGDISALKQMRAIDDISYLPESQDRSH